MKLIDIHDFYISVSMLDLVTWFGEDDNQFSGNAFLENALDALCLNVDLKEIYSTYFDKTQVGEGDVYLYYQSKESSVFFALDSYRCLTDQLDIVSLGICSDKENINLVRNSLRSFFDMASCQVRYEESAYSISLRDMTDESRYPLSIEESGYQQRIFKIYG